MKKNRRILVTGCSSGFGFLIARTMLNGGHTVFAAMRDLERKNSAAAQKLKASVNETPGKLHLLDMDVSDTPSVSAAVQKALKLEGAIDVVVNNAG